MKTWLKFFLGTLTVLLIIFIASISYMFYIFNILDNVKLINENNKISKQVIHYRYSTMGHIIIDVNINNSKETYPFILDSGASTYVFDNFLEYNYLPSIGKSPVIGSGGGGFLSSIYQIDTLALGKIRFNSVATKSIAKLPIPCTDNIYGILGKEVMQHLIWQIDFENQQILVATDKEQLNFNKNAHIISLTENQYGHQLYTKVQIGKDTIEKQFTIDLGNNGYASTNIEILSSQNNNKINIEGSNSTGLDGDYKATAFLQEVSNFKMGDLAVPNFSVYASKSPMNLLGLGFFKNYRTTISWKDKKLILEPYENQYFGRKGFGYSARFDEQENALLVKAIYEGLQADSLGIQPGDKILSLNGQIIDKASKYCNFDYKGIDELTLELEQNGVTRQVTLEKRDYFPQQQQLVEQVSMK